MEIFAFFILINKYGKINYLGLIEKILIENEILYFPISKSVNTKSKFKMNYNNVKLSTIHSVKGLDSKVVFICGINNGMLKFSTYEMAKKLIYVGMTRARGILSVTYSVKNEITDCLCNVFDGDVEHLENYTYKTSNKVAEEPEKYVAAALHTEDKKIRELNTNRPTIVDKIKSIFKL